MQQTASYTKLRNLSVVMPALVAGIHVFLAHPIKDVDGRDKPGHDVGESQGLRKLVLFDQLVGGHLHDQRHREAECLRRFEIDDEFDLGRLHHRKLGGLLTLEDAIYIEGRLAEQVV